MAKVKPIPENLHTLTPQLTCKGAAQAIEFYKKVFGAQEMMRFAGPGGSIMHASIRIGDSTMFLNDEFPEMGNISPTTLGNTSVTLTIYTEDSDAMFKRAVDAGAQVKMPLDNQFWGDRYGEVQDPFGHRWAIATHIEDLSPDELKKRGTEAMSQMSQGKN